MHLYIYTSVITLATFTSTLYHWHQRLCLVDQCVGLLSCIVYIYSKTNANVVSVCVCVCVLSGSQIQCLFRARP